MDEEHGMAVDLHSERRSDVDCITGSLGDVNLRVDFERAFDATKKVVRESGVSSVVGASIVGDLKLPVGVQE